jgi:hypothetical protein
MKILEGIDRVNAEHLSTLNEAIITLGNDRKLFKDNVGQMSEISFSAIEL